MDAFPWHLLLLPGLALPLLLMLGAYADSKMLARRLGPIAAGLERGSVVRYRRGRFRRGRWVAEGWHAGRPVRVRLDPAWGLIYEMEVPPGTATLALPDARHLREWVGAGAQAREAEAAIQHLGTAVLSNITVKRGWLSATRGPSEFSMRPESVRQVFDAFAQLVPLLGRKALTIRVAGVERQAVAWTIDERTLCPFCRDGLQADVDLAACDACHTVHHRACLDEAGGCTVFGCRRGPQSTVRA